MMIFKPLRKRFADAAGRPWLDHIQALIRAEYDPRPSRIDLCRQM